MACHIKLLPDKFWKKSPSLVAFALTLKKLLMSKVAAGRIRSTPLPPLNNDRSLSKGARKLGNVQFFSGTLHFYGDIQTCTEHISKRYEHIPIIGGNSCERISNICRWLRLTNPAVNTNLMGLTFCLRGGDLHVTVSEMLTVSFWQCMATRAILCVRW